MEELVFIGTNDQVMTNSLLVAEKFGKRHDNILQAIRGLLKNQDTEKMFEESSYLTSQNKQMPMYLMNRDGFVLLAMGLTGTKAMEFKVSYIEAFNKMESYIRQQTQSQPQQLSQAQMLLQSAQLLVDIENRQAQQEQKTLMLEQKIVKMEEEKKQAQLELFDVPVSDNDVPQITLRTQVNNLVALYAEANDITYQDAWRFFYKQMLDRYHVRFNEDKARSIRKLDDVERRGYMQKFFDLVSFFVKRARS